MQLFLLFVPSSFFKKKNVLSMGKLHASRVRGIGWASSTSNPPQDVPSLGKILFELICLIYIRRYRTRLDVCKALDEDDCLQAFFHRTGFVIDGASHKGTWHRPLVPPLK